VVSRIAPAATREAGRQLIREIARNAVSETVAGTFLVADRAHSPYRGISLREVNLKLTR
jgi:hypothetical protein